LTWITTCAKTVLTTGFANWTAGGTYYLTDDRIVAIFTDATIVNENSALYVTARASCICLVASFA
jgi:hypothetical protein